MSRSSTSACRRTSATRGCALRSSSGAPRRRPRFSSSPSTSSTRMPSELLAEAGGGGVGYLLKDRVIDVADFVDAVRRVGSGGTALDPEVVAQLVGGRRAPGLADLTPREREVLQSMAEGRSNTGDRRCPRAHGRSGREAHREHLSEASAPTVGHRQSPRARRARVPPRLKGATGARARRSRSANCRPRSW